MNSPSLPDRIVHAALEVHKTLGPGLLESAYEACLVKELELRKLHVERQKPLSLSYKGIHVPCCYRLDLIVENTVIIEIKTATGFTPIHEAQLLTCSALYKFPCVTVTETDTVTEPSLRSPRIMQPEAHISPHLPSTVAFQE